MGFDVFGEEPDAEVGKYFRNNVWWWRPLWEYVVDNCGLTSEQVTAGLSNDGVLIDKSTAERIAKTLKGLIEQGLTKKFEVEYMKMLDELPDEVCDLCGGTGVRNDEIVKGTCNKCDGKGKVRPFDTWYPFSEENVKNFAEFCEHSGGFRIS